MFKKIGAHPDGLDPLQQRTAIKFMDRVKRNLDGFYPALTRVLLLMIGPYRDAVQVNPKSAFGLLREAFFLEMKRLPDLHANHPEKLSHYIPPGIRYDAEKGALIRRYRGGEERATELASLKIEPISFTSQAIRSRPKAIDPAEQAPQPN